MSLLLLFHLVLALTLKGVASTCTYNDPAPDRRFDKLSTVEIMRAQGYPAETHEVITKDGYVITLHRVSNKGRMPVFVLHGILCSSRDWLMQRGNNSLPYQLYDAGYDVWLGNMRGNDYSKKHLKLSVYDRRYWDFSIDEIAQTDVPAFISYISKATGKAQIHCMGYSLGAGSQMAALSRGLLGSKCKTFIGMAPVARNHYSRAPGFFLPALFARPEQPLKFLLYGLEKTGQFTPRLLNYILRKFAPAVCKVDIFGICSKIAYLTLGPPHPSQIDPAMEHRLFQNFPSTTSIRTYIHIIRGSADRNPYSEYFYQTAAENIKYYGQRMPPAYNLTNIRTRFWVFVGVKDWVAPPADVKDWFLEVGSPSKKMMIVGNQHWTHLDFLMGKEACQLVYAPIISTLLRSDSDAHLAGIRRT